MARASSQKSIDTKLQPGFSFIAAICVLVLYLPILVVAAFSFNDANSIGASWRGFTTSWYALLWKNEGFFDAAVMSLFIAVVATIVSTALATAAALATTRVKPWNGQVTSIVIIGLPLIVPEIVGAIALLSFFAFFAQTFDIRFGIFKLLAAHSAICVPFAYLPIRARLAGMDVTLENAAADLYANGWKTFRHITFPLLIPGISSGAALAFIISFDNFTVTQMIAGPGETTLPLFIWGRIRNTVTPELNAMCTALLVVSMAFVILSFVLTNRKNTE